MEETLDVYIDKLGTYFVHHNILERFGITFETFFKMNERGDWKEFVA